MDNQIDANKRRAFAALAGRRHGRILELGPLDGRDTIHLAPLCDELIAIEGRPENIDRTRDTVRSAGLSNLELVRGNLETFDLAELGRFDLVWCSGVLYHLPRPWELMRQIATVSDRCLGWSHLAEAGLQNWHGYWGRVLGEEPTASAMAGLSSMAFWMLPYEFLRAWRDAGFTRAEFLTEPQPHHNGGFAAEFITEKE